MLVRLLYSVILLLVSLPAVSKRDAKTLFKDCGSYQVQGRLHCPDFGPCSLTVLEGSNSQAEIAVLPSERPKSFAGLIVSASVENNGKALAASKISLDPSEEKSAIVLTKKKACL